MLAKSRFVIVLLLVASAATFAVGVAVERSGHHDESGAGVGDPNAPEGSAAREGSEKNAPAPATGANETTSEQLFGVNTESNTVIAFVVAISLLLAIGVLVIRSPFMLVGIAVFGIGGAVFDVREVLHQLDESRTGVAALAAVIVALHLALALLAAGMLLAKRREAQTVASSSV